MGYLCQTSPITAQGTLLKGQPWRKESKSHREWRTPRKQSFYINRINTHEFIRTDVALAPTSQVCTRGNLRAERSRQMTLFVVSFIKYIVITVSVHSNTPNHPFSFPLHQIHCFLRFPSKKRMPHRDIHWTRPNKGRCFLIQFLWTPMSSGYLILWAQFSWRSWVL